MQSKKEEKASSVFVTEDVGKAKALKVLFDSAHFQVKGNAVTQTALLLAWLQGLEEKINRTLSAPKGASVKREKL